MEDGVRAIGIGSHLHPGFDEVRPQRAFRDLQLQTVVGNAIVVADLTLLLHAKHLVEIDAGDCHERRSRLLRGSRKPGVMGGDIDIAQEGVGRRRWLPPPFRFR